MFESPLIREIVAERSHKDILRVSRNRFGPVPPGLEAEVRSILDEAVLDAALDLATSSPDLEHFGADCGRSPGLPNPGTRPMSASPSWSNGATMGQMTDR